MADKSPFHEKYSELFEIPEEGFVLRETPKLRGNRAYFYFISLDGNMQKKHKIESIDAKEFNELSKELTGYIKSIHGVSYYNSAKNARDIKVEESEKSHVRMSNAMKQYDRTFALQLMQMAKKQAWFSEIIEQLGMTTLFMILQIAHIPPRQWYQEIKKYKNDPDAFMDFADQYVVALFDAKEDAEKYLELRNKYAYCIANEVFYKHEIIKYKKLVQELYTELNAAIYLIPKSELQRFSLWLALRKMSQAAVVTEKDLENKED